MKKTNKKREQNDVKDETVMYKPVKPYKEKQAEDKKNKKRKKKHPKLRKVIKILIIMFILLCVIGAGVVGALAYRCIWGDWAISREDLEIAFENSKFYDKEGNVIAVLSGEENREIISKDQMSPYLFKAFISIEDERFESHHGVDWKRTLGATFTFLTHSGESSYGGSTITQQLVKNFTDEKDDSGIDGALRKVKEIFRAYEVENILSKDQVLELYLNLIPLGGGSNFIYGVQTAARYYFNKNASDLDVVECAYLAGITSAPERYNPFRESTDKEEINKKVRTVLKKMYELGKITEEEYNAGIQEVDAGIKFEKGEVSQNTKLSYYLEEARDQIVEDLMEANNWSAEQAKTHLYGDGYNIYTNLDQNVQKEVDAQFVDNAKNWYVVTPKNVQRQGAMVVIDNETGYVVAASGGLGEKTVSEGTNRINIKSHNPGSCIKPIAIVGPSMEEGKITLGSVIDDVPLSLGDYKPVNWYLNNGFYGYMPLRRVIEKSANLPEITILKMIGVPTSLSYLEKMGVDITDEENDGLALALGGMTHGLTAVEMAGCYATIENGGVYRTPLFYTKITDKDGNTVYEAKQEETRVFSEQNAWLLTDLLKQPIYGSEGTGTAAAISGQQVRRKNRNNK